MITSICYFFVIETRRPFAVSCDSWFCFEIWRQMIQTSFIKAQTSHNYHISMTQTFSKMNTELAQGEHAHVRLGRIERAAPNVEWKMQFQHWVCGRISIFRFALF